MIDIELSQVITSWLYFSNGFFLLYQVLGFFMAFNYFSTQFIFFFFLLKKKIIYIGANICKLPEIKWLHVHPDIRAFF